jgi:hypothetical protein
MASSSCVHGANVWLPHINWKFPSLQYGTPGASALILYFYSLPNMLHMSSQYYFL